MDVTYTNFFNSFFRHWANFLFNTLEWNNRFFFDCAINSEPLLLNCQNSDSTLSPSRDINTLDHRYTLLKEVITQSPLQLSAFRALWSLSGSSSPELQRKENLLILWSRLSEDGLKRKSWNHRPALISLTAATYLEGLTHCTILYHFFKDVCAD